MGNWAWAAEYRSACSTLTCAWLQLFSRRGRLCGARSGSPISTSFTHHTIITLPVSPRWIVRGRLSLCSLVFARTRGLLGDPGAHCRRPNRSDIDRVCTAGDAVAPGWTGPAGVCGAVPVVWWAGTTAVLALLRSLRTLYTPLRDLYILVHGDVRAWQRDLSQYGTMAMTGQLYAITWQPTSQPGQADGAFDGDRWRCRSSSCRCLVVAHASLPWAALWKRLRVRRLSRRCPMQLLHRHRRAKPLLTDIARGFAWGTVQRHPSFLLLVQLRLRLLLPWGLVHGLILVQRSPLSGAQSLG